ncbi:MAG TPA: amidohydrolase family protein [Candidatus Binatia bacterium]|jgi:predicted TIM-barrel fold metal-dependent hydrolase|nr:amidohydrolase family protein [Candidatus Binatia bacterium]
MDMPHKPASASIRARLTHPVIDADGHWIEFEPTLLDYLKQVGGPTMVERFRQEDYLAGLRSWSRMTPEERRARRPTQPAWWGFPAKNSLDRATAMLPRLLYERMEDIGLDFAVVYPTLALFFPAIKDLEVQRAAYRAYNLMAADLFRGLGDRLIPAACIPMHAPAEALEELDVVVNRLGLKALMLTSLMRRPIPAAHQEGATNRYATWPDTLGLESDYDYDLVWAKCVELKVVPTFHTAAQGIGTRVSYSNFVYNHIGHFAAAGEAVCKSLFLNGVTRRFPTLKFAFLEGGVGWACMLYSDLIGHWKKRNLQALDNTNPANLNLGTLAEGFRRYGTDSLTAHIDQLESLCHLLGDVEAVDDFARCGITHPADIRDLFVPNFYFGCEADDPVNAWAFRAKTNPFHVKLHALMGSDIGHFDVADMTAVLAEAHELVDDGLLTEDDFRDFVFGNPVRLWAGSNPDFFKGTAIEKQAADYLMRQNAHQQSAAAGS